MDVIGEGKSNVSVLFVFLQVMLFSCISDWDFHMCTSSLRCISNSSSFHPSLSSGSIGFYRNYSNSS